MKIINPNSQCWCGSKKKYKKCHLKKDILLLDFKNRGYEIADEEILKSAEDIKGIKKSAKLTTEILDMIGHHVKIGITTMELNDIVHNYTIEHGAIPAPLDYEGFPCSICTSLNNVICHGIPDDTKLKSGDIMNIDVTCIVDNYFSDSNRMFLIGDVSPEAETLVEVSRQCLELGIKSVKPYQPINVIGEAISSHAEKFGYSVVQDYCGHGVGFQFHERPEIWHFRSNEKGMIMVPGMVFTIEPMINQGTYHTELQMDGWTSITRDRKLSSQWEHTLVVTETGCEVLT